MKSQVRKNPIVRKQPPLQLTKLIRVREWFPPTPVLCLPGSRLLTCLPPCFLPSHEPDSFLTEVFSVGCIQESGSFHILEFSETSVSPGEKSFTALPNGARFLNPRHNRARFSR